MASFGKMAAASLVFAILYALMFVYMIFMYATKRYKWKSRFTILFFHCMIRVASQACGVAFGVLTWSNIDVFVAYLVLAAEGYFSLTIASYYFLRHYEVRHFGHSRLGRDAKDDQNKSTWKRTLEIWSWAPLWAPWRYWDNDLIMIVDAWLIPANAIIITGGSLMVGANNADNNLTPEQAQKRLDTSKGLRTAGQAIFFALTCLWVLLVCNTFIKTVRRRLDTKARVACIMFSVIGAFLIARGLFGILQAAIYSLSYYNPENYDAGGFTSHFVAVENCLAVMPEFTAAAILNISWWFTRKPRWNEGSMETELHTKERTADPNSPLDSPNYTDTGRLNA